MTGEPLEVARRELAAPRQQLLEPVELRLPERRRDVGQPVVVAELDHRVGPVAAGRELGRDAVVPEAPQRARPGRRRSVRTAPPSPVVMILAGWRLSTVMSASVPTGRPLERRARASATRRR